MKNLPVVYDHRRGCGYRKPGGLYLMAPAGGHPCCKLPIPLHICPTCGGGIKPARGWSWFDSDHFISKDPCPEQEGPFLLCPLAEGGLGRQGLIWVGEKFYPHPADFMAEVAHQGFSRRIPHLPKDFKLGETWVFLAHRKAMSDANGPISGVFFVFQPTQIQYVVKGDETDEALERLEKRGISPVHVVNLTDAEVAA